MRGASSVLVAATQRSGAPGLSCTSVSSCATTVSSAPPPRRPGLATPTRNLSPTLVPRPLAASPPTDTKLQQNRKGL